MQEVGVDVDDGFATVDHCQTAVAGEVTNDVGLDLPTTGQCEERIRIGAGHDHSLLRLREPNLPRGQARVLEWYRGQVDPGAELVGHLPDGGGEATGATVGDGVVETLIPSGDHEIDQTLLDDGVADLHRRPGHLGGGVAHRLGGERRSADTVTPHLAAEHDHVVAHLGPRRIRTAGQQPDAAGEHQRRRRVGRIVEDGTGDVRHADLVSVVGDAGDHSGADPTRMQHARREGPAVDVLRAETEDVGDGDRFGRHAQDVAHHAPDARVGATERFQCGGVIVGLGLEGQVVGLVEPDDAGVVDERAFHPRGRDGLGRAP